jgi:hypothetical protein
MFKYENQSLCIKIFNGSIGSMGADRKRMLKLKEKFACFALECWKEIVVGIITTYLLQLRH